MKRNQLAGFSLTALTTVNEIIAQAKPRLQAMGGIDRIISPVFETQRAARTGRPFLFSY